MRNVFKPQPKQTLHGRDAGDLRESFQLRIACVVMYRLRLELGSYTLDCLTRDAIDCLIRGGRSSAACKHGLLFVYAQRTYDGPPVLA